MKYYVVLLECYEWKVDTNERLFFCVFQMLPQGDEPPSMEHILASEIYPKTALTSDDATLTVPFPTLPGENVQYLGRTAEGVIALSNFRLFIRHHGPVLNIPLALIDTIEGRDIFFLYVYCKDARSLR